MAFEHSGERNRLESSFGGADFGGRGFASVGVVYPVFNDFAGRSWESRYPDAVASYYAAIEAVGVAACGGGVVSNGVQSDDVCNRFRRHLGMHLLGWVDGRVGSGVVESTDHGNGVCAESDDGGKVDGRFKSGSVRDSSSSLGDTFLASAVSGDDVVAKGKHYKRNKAKARKRRSRVDSVAQTGVVVEEQRVFRQGGAFVDCSADIRRQLQESRAEMLIEKNKAEKAKAESCVRHYQMVKESRVNETRFELRRQTSEEKLREISKKRLGEGYVEGTVYSSAATPFLSSGSVSPNSSISMAEVKRREGLFQDMERRVAALDLEKVAWDEEKKKIEKKYSVYEAQEANRKQLAKERAAIQRSVGMDGYSRWD